MTVKWRRVKSQGMAEALVLSDDEKLADIMLTHLPVWPELEPQDDPLKCFDEDQAA